MSDRIYMYVSKDKYELPLAVANSIPELARIIGKNKNSIKSQISRTKSKGRKSQYVEVEIDGEEKEEKAEHRHSANV